MIHPGPGVTLLLSLLIALKPAAAQSQALDGDDFQHAMVELEAMLQDRPALTEHLIANDPLRSWTLARFAGSGSGRRLHWDPRLPPAGVEAQHGWGQTIAIRVHPIHQSGVQRGQFKAFSDIWADLIFELHNAAQAQHFANAWEQVTRGELSRLGWLETVARREHRALLYTQAFHRTRWRLWMRDREVPTTGRRWRLLLAVPMDFGRWVSRFTARSGYPFAAYGSHWQAVIEELGLNPWRVFDPFEMHLLKESKR